MKAEIVSVGTASSSTYNGDGLRMSHTISGAATNYVWDVASALPVVLTDGSNTLVYGLDLISSTDSGGNQTYYLYDGLGSTVNLTNTSGNSTQSYTYWAFGDHHVGPPPGSNQWLFTGEQRDTDSGLYYLRARYYDPAIGRFLGRDPLPGGNLYTYTSNNPVNRTDPSGLCFGLGDCGIIDDVAHASISVGSDLTVEQFQDLYDGADAFANHPASFPQILVGTAVALSSAGNRGRSDGAAYTESCWGTCWLLLKVLRHPAITLGHNVFATGRLNTCQVEHERTHVRQGDKYGPAWGPVYWWESLSVGYRDNRFEVEAFGIQDSCEAAAKE